ncbi:MAG: aromatic amino acid ammonia-lyase [Pseudomonadota bacterium]
MQAVSPRLRAVESGAETAIAAQNDDRPSITLTGQGLAIGQAVRIASGSAHLALSAPVAAAIAAGHERLARAVAEQRQIYGITTGFGPLANRFIPPAHADALQQGLINHLATGVGPNFGWAEARMILLCRLLSVARGHSGASPELVALLLAVLASPFAPRIPQMGTVGASGDLTPLSHLALALMGRGAFIDRAGNRVENGAVFAQIAHPPFRPVARDALAIVNGTSAMTGIAALNHIATARLLGWLTALGLGYAEVLGARAEAWHPAFAAVRPHPGQIRQAEALRARAAGSARLVTAPVAEHRLEIGAEVREHSTALQDAYTLRCIPQLLGAAEDVLAFHGTVVTREMHAATDNPIFPESGPPALHGGNFMGQHVAYAADALSNAVIGAAQLAERQVARITDERLNDGLPPFLQRGTPGLNSGLMGAQVTATALLAEMRSQAVPASIQSISTNGANQDVVSMGTIAARNCARHIENANRIAAILALAVAQAVEIRRDQDRHDGFSPATAALVAAIRTRSAPLAEDRPLSSDIEDIAALIAQTDAPA